MSRPIVTALLKAGIEARDAQAFVDDLRSTPPNRRTARAATLLEDLCRRYRRCDRPRKDRSRDARYNRSAMPEQPQPLPAPRDPGDSRSFALLLKLDLPAQDAHDLLREVQQMAGQNILAKLDAQSVRLDAQYARLEARLEAKLDALEATHKAQMQALQAQMQALRTEVRSVKWWIGGTIGFAVLAVTVIQALIVWQATG